ncbi:MAG: soluble [2Fe-2S] ferredoxin, partial [uncultured Rubrobacteraceae bacterium]
GEEAQGYFQEERPHHRDCRRRVHTRSRRGRWPHPPLRLPQRYVHDVHPEVPRRRDRPGHGLCHRRRGAGAGVAPHLHWQSPLRRGARRI